MKRRVRVAAWLLVMAIVLSALPMNLIQAAESGQREVQQEEQQEKPASELLKMMYVQPDSMAEDGGQLIVAEAVQGNGTLTGARLYYRDPAGSERELGVTEISGELAAFLVKGNGINQDSLTRLELTLGGKVHNIDLNAYQNRNDTIVSKVEGEEELADPKLNKGSGLSVEEIKEAERFVADDSGDIGAALNQAERMSAAPYTSRMGSAPGGSLSKANGTVIVVLDPGHGGSESGADRRWNGVDYIEKDINLKISKYTRQELEKYEGVKVYLTRTTDKYMTLEERVNYGIAKKATVFISQHINSTSSYEQYGVSGAMVFLSKGQYNKDITNISHEIANSILAKLKEAGFKNQGILYTLSTDGETYPNGALADYYGIIRRCVLARIPGMIVEHGFVNNPNDCVKFFGSNAKIKKIGQADAKAIASYYGLKLKTTSVTPTPPTETPIPTTGWIKEGTTWYYLKEDGSRMKGWQIIDTKQYYFDANGLMATGKKRISGKDHYFHETGEVMTGVQQIGNTTAILNSKGLIEIKPAGSWYSSGKNWYFKRTDGKKASGWVEYKGKKCYLSKDGKMNTGWTKIKGRWFYFSKNGYMQTGQKILGGKPYYLSTAGYALTGKQVINKKTVYLGTKGEIIPSRWVQNTKGWRYRYGDGSYAKKKWETISKKKYYFNKQGYMVTGWVQIGKTWYYLSDSGVARTGWLESKGKWFYLKQGKMLTNTWVKSSGKWYYVKKNGNMVVNTKLKIDKKTYRFDTTGRCTNKK